MFQRRLPAAPHQVKSQLPGEVRNRQVSGSGGTTSTLTSGGSNLIGCTRQSAASVMELSIVELLDGGIVDMERCVMGMFTSQTRLATIASGRTVRHICAS